MIRKVYEVEPMVCPRCGGTMKVIAFLTGHADVKTTMIYYHSSAETKPEAMT